MLLVGLLQLATLALTLIGAHAMTLAQWPSYLLVLGVVTALWPFGIQLAEGVEFYLPVMWTSAAAAYVLGAPFLLVFHLSTVLGFLLIFGLDRLQLVPATGIAAEETQRLTRGAGSTSASFVDGAIAQLLFQSMAAVRVVLLELSRQFAPGLNSAVLVIVGEIAVVGWLQIVPAPGRMGTKFRRSRYAADLGYDVLLATDALHIIMTLLVVLSFQRAGLMGFAAAGAATVVPHLILKRLADARLQSQQRRRALVASHEELRRRTRLATIAETATQVFRSVEGHHRAIREASQQLVAVAPDVHTHTESILLSVDEAGRVVSELVQFGHNRTVLPHHVGVRRLLEACRGDCAARAQTKAVVIDLSATEELTAYCDETKVREAIGNLLDNGIDVSPRGGRVELRAQASDGGVVITVRDYGAGVPALLSDRLSTPFFTTKPEGLGLGLALAREVVEAHGGTLGWEAARPGMTFRVRLPPAP